MTKEFVENLYVRGQNGVLTYLRPSELKELAYEWLRVHVPHSQYVQFPPTEGKELADG